MTTSRPKHLTGVITAVKTCFHERQQFPFRFSSLLKIAMKCISPYIFEGGPATTNLENFGFLAPGRQSLPDTRITYGIRRSSRNILFRDLIFTETDEILYFVTSLHFAFLILTSNSCTKIRNIVARMNG